MVKTVKIYIEGDTKQKGKGNFISLRQGFSEFFTKWASKEKLNIKFDNKVLGSRGDAVNIFLSDQGYYPNDLSYLLIDTEREKSIDKSAKAFLQEDFPNSDFKDIEESQCHFMVQAMESWFLADKERLANCYDNKFKENVLPKNNDVEKILKKDVLEGLKNATKETKNGKGRYDKGEMAGKILGSIDPQEVRKSASHCKKLFAAIADALK